MDHLSQHKTYIFFKISVPDADDPQTWAERMHNVYGFEYHTINIDDETILAWAFSDEMELHYSLLCEGIDYETFEVSDLTEFFGL